MNNGKDKTKDIVQILGAITGSIVALSVIIKSLFDPQDNIYIATALYISIFAFLFWFAFYRKRAQKWWFFSSLLGLLIITAAFFLLVGTRVVNSSTSQLTFTPPYLISGQYEIDNFDPHLFDLRKVTDQGVPVSPGRALRIFDLWIAIPESHPDYLVQAEIYANNQIIGSTPAQPVIAGVSQLEAIHLENYLHGEVQDAWRVQGDWETLDIVIVTYAQGKAISTSYTSMPIEPGSKAWLIEPPSARFVSVLYSINDSSPITLDLRYAEEDGIPAQVDDTFQIDEIWYHSDLASESFTVVAEAYLTNDDFDLETYLSSAENVIRDGIYMLKEYTPFQWVIEDENYLVLSLARSDGVVMDRLVIPLRRQ